jgi:transcriptional regulator with XRE-family HTH domain
MATNPKTGSDEFGELLRLGRERLGMSRRDLVEATGLSYPYISQLETGYRQPSPTAIQKLADALQLSLDDLFSAMAKGRRDEMAVDVEPDSSSPWVRNASYSEARGRRRAAARSRSFRPTAAAPVPPGPPMGLLAHGDIDADAPPGPVEEHFLMLEMPPEFDTDAVVGQVVELFSALPAGVRLEALARVQAEIVHGVIDEGIREGLEN